ncbi:MAG: DinB family protein [Thermomicrobiaceae bacterium]|nr:DinB family protein [Thermomicrobiaceae bacterium]
MEVYRELIDTLAGTPQRLRELLAGQEGAGPRSLEAWGPLEVVVHLIDVERLQRGRMQRILEERTPYLRSWDQEAAARAHDYAAITLPEALETFTRERSDTVHFLITLAIKDWERTGIHDEYGELSIEDLAEKLISHDAEHLEQLASLAR